MLQCGSLIVLILIHSGHTAKLDNEILDTPILSCGPNEIGLEAKTRQPFEGRAFIQGHYRTPECSEVFDDADNTTTNPKIAIALSRISSCGLNFQRQNEAKTVTLKATVVFAFHPQFVTAADRSFAIECSFLQYDVTVQAQLDSIKELSTTALITGTALTPMVNLEITAPIQDANRNNFDPVVLRVGERMLLTWSLENGHPVYGIRILSCEAETRNAERHTLVLDMGCSVDETLLTHAKYSNDDSQAFSEGYAFKFADEDEVHFRCHVQLCIRKFEHLILNGHSTSDLCSEPVKCGRKTRSTNVTNQSAAKVMQISGKYIAKDQNGPQSSALVLPRRSSSNWCIRRREVVDSFIVSTISVIIVLVVTAVYLHYKGKKQASS